MKKILLLLLTIAILGCLGARAQFRYTLKDTTTAYSALTNATSLNGTLIWDEENLTAPMPFTWVIDSAYQTNKFNLSLATPLPGVLADTTNPTSVNGFFFGDLDLEDRGWIDSLSSRSPIRFITTGTSPNRIFKMELSNAGFYDEMDNYHTMDDYINLQVWVYEAGNIVEFHFGPSQINHAALYFLFSGVGPAMGYAQHVNVLTGTTGNLYYLTSSPSAPVIDTAQLPNLPGYLNSWPASGQVYRFTPNWRNCTLPASAYTAGIPSGRTIQYTYSGSTPVDSVLWDFGDGSTSKTLNPSHTFSNNGVYNICVTAYNSCGSNRYCKQASLAVGNLAGLGNVKVYPTCW